MTSRKVIKEFDEIDRKMWEFTVYLQSEYEEIYDTTDQQISWLLLRITP